MAELIIQNPSITPNVFEFDEAGRVSAISGYPLAGEGGDEVVKSDLMWKPVINSDGTLGWARDTSATIPATADLVPHIQDNYWYVGTSNTDVEARGPQGPAGANGTNGIDGKDGKDGVSPTVTTATIPGGSRVTFTYGEGSTESIDVMSGASGESGYSPTITTATIPGGSRVTFTYGEGSTESIDVMSGASGESGYSPTITTATTADAQHPQSGVNVTVTDIDGNKSFNIWNGIDGQGATVNLLEGDGIQITHNGADYTIGVSADYALKSELPDVSDMATKTWTSAELDKKIGIPTWDSHEDPLKLWNSYTSGWNDFQEVMEDEGVVTINDFKDPNYPLLDAGHGISGYFDDDEYNFGYHFGLWNNYEQAIQTISAKVMIPNSADANLKNKYLVLKTKADGTVDGWTDFQNQCYSKTEADGRYMQKNTDFTLSGNGTTNNPLGLDMTNAYTIDGINGITAVPDATSNKVIVKMTDDTWGYYQHLAASASEWDKISGLSAKSNVNITSAGVTTVTNTSGTTENKFTQYAEVASHPTPRMFLCATADSVADITSVLTAASGMGAVIFVIESHS